MAACSTLVEATARAKEKAVERRSASAAPSPQRPYLLMPSCAALRRSDGTCLRSSALPFKAVALRPVGGAGSRQSPVAYCSSNVPIHDRTHRNLKQVYGSLP